MSRIRSKEKSDLSDTLAEISAITRVGGHSDTEVASQDSERVILSPVPAVKATVVYTGPSEPEKLGPQNTITQERGIHVTRYRPEEGGDGVIEPDIEAGDPRRGEP